MSQNRRDLLLEANVDALGRRVRDLEEVVEGLRAQLRAQVVAADKRADELESRLRALEGEAVQRLALLECQQVADRLGISVFKVRVDAKSGVLRALNTRKPPAHPIYRITEEALREYEEYLATGNKCSVHRVSSSRERRDQVN